MIDHPFSVNGKTFLIAGASSGIGQATAILLAKMGAKLIVLGRNEKRLQETLDQMPGSYHVSYICDLIQEEAMKDLVSNLPILDGIFYSAGISKMAPIRYMTDDVLEETFDINFFAPYKLTRMLLKNKKIQNSASLLYMASAGAYIGVPGQSAYSPAKNAIISLVRVLAKELSPRKITVNCLSPGMVRTPLLKDAPINAEQYKNDEASYPLGYGEPEDIANAALYFLSDASKWVTGISFVMDGGLTLR